MRKTDATGVFFGVGYILLAFLLAGVVTSENLPASKDCSLPQSWNGNWFQKDYDSHLVEIDHNSITRPSNHHHGMDIGVCKRNKEDYYIFEFEKTCIRCLFIQRHHANVLSYKESNEHCEPIESDETVENICLPLFDGIEEVHYLFKQNYKAIECPFREEAFEFSYSTTGSIGTNNKEVCSHPPSHVDKCMDDTQLLFKYEGCPDNTAALTTELTCVGSWSDGDVKFLVAEVKVHNPRPNPVEGRFRCFVYNHIPGSTNTIRKGQTQTDIDGYKIGSFDLPTCSGLHSPDSGERTLTLYKGTKKNGDQSETFCSFPEWFFTNTWHTLTHETAFHNSTSRSEIFITSSHFAHPMGFWPQHAKLTCWKSKRGVDSEIHIVAKEVVGCNVKTICLKLSKRTEFVSQMKVLKHPEDMSQDEFISYCLDANSVPSASHHIDEDITLVNRQGFPSKCPLRGSYDLDMLKVNGRPIKWSCQSLDPLLRQPYEMNSGDGFLQPYQMEFVDNCTGDDEKLNKSVAECLGSWTVNDVEYFLISFPKKLDDVLPLIYCFHVSNETGVLIVHGTPGNCLSVSAPSLSIQLIPKDLIITEKEHLTLDSGAIHLAFSLPTIVFLVNFVIIYYCKY